jgi:hypothetical protein
MAELTPEERLRRAERAKLAYEEFVKPEMDFAREHYTRRLVEIATQEMDSRRRADKIANLSVALRIHEEIDKGFQLLAEDGSAAAAAKQQSPDRRRNPGGRGRSGRPILPSRPGRPKRLRPISTSQCRLRR